MSLPRIWPEMRPSLGVLLKHLMWKIKGLEAKQRLENSFF